MNMRRMKVILNDTGHTLVGNLIDLEMTQCGPYSVPEYRARFVADEDYMRKSRASAGMLLDAIFNGPKKSGNTLDISGSVTNAALKARRVIFNPPATIVLWEDRTKTVVKCDPEDTFDEMKGLALYYMKKALGNTSRELNKALRNR